ncbi:hypothetical protein ACWCQZ_20085 [Streptomyces sp. NPDC002285]
MTSPSRTSSTRWLLEATCQAAHCDNPAWEQQRQLLRSVAFFDIPREVWVVRIGAVDAKALGALQTLYEAARRFGTHVQIEATVAPDDWQGPVFDDDSELARLASARTDQPRRLGQLPSA